MVLLLAEIWDKMPTVAGTTVVACLIAAVSIGLGLIRRWLVLLPLPVIAFYDWALCRELLEPGFGKLVVDELGWGWVVGQFVGWNLPYAVGVVACVRISPRRPRRLLDRVFLVGAMGAFLIVGGAAVWTHGAKTVGRAELQFPSHESNGQITGRTLALFHGDGAIRLTHEWFRRRLDVPSDAEYYRQRLSVDHDSWSIEHLAPDRYPKTFAYALNDWRLLGLGLYDATRQDVSITVIELPLWLVIVGGALLLTACIRAYTRRGQQAHTICTGCGYNLTGNVTGRCPECGRTFARRDNHHATHAS